MFGFDVTLKNAHQIKELIPNYEPEFSQVFRQFSTSCTSLASSLKEYQVCLFFEQLKVFLKEFGINFNDPFVKILSMRCAGGITFVVDRGIQRIPYDGTDILYHPKISSSGFNIMDLYQYYLNSHVQLFSKIKAYKSNIYHRYVGEEHRCVGESGKDLFKVICVCNNTLTTYIYYYYQIFSIY